MGEFNGPQVTTLWFKSNPRSHDNQVADALWQRPEVLTGAQY